MAFDAHKNFAISTVATAPSPATSGTSLVVASGDGTKFPSVSFYAVVWPTSANPTTANAEIVRVTAISTDTLTITRTQESTSARTVIVGDQIAACVTAKALKDIEDFLNSGSLTAHGVLIGNGTGAIVASAAGTAGQPLRSGGASADPSFVAVTTGLVANTSAGAISTSSKMLGLAGSITPTGSGKVHVTVCGTISTSITTSAELSWQITYGTNSAPANGDAATGTTVGSQQVMSGISQNASREIPFSLTYIISGLTVGTAYWLDLTVNPQGTTTITHASLTAFEL